MDLATIRTEIKNWERSFKSSNGRNATVEDIKLLPQIADKYKLYKKLSKSATQVENKPSSLTPAHNNSDPPSTPPRSRPHASHPQPILLLSKPRVSQTTAPLSTFNPFSPQKNKGKQKETTTKTIEARSNPFASPLKAKPKTLPRPPSPSLFPLRSSTSACSPPHSPPAPSSAISRARKRLRGEPVSPSPNKDKRRRVGTQTMLPSTMLVSDSSDSDDEVNLDFVSDSPVKAPTGKPFKLLFDESSAPPSASGSKSKPPLERMKSVANIRSLFGEKVLDSINDDEEWGMGRSYLKADKGKKIINGNKLPAILAINGSAGHAPVENASSMVISSTNSPLERTSAKRSLSDTETETQRSAEELSRGAPLLLPPSPQSTGSSTQQGPGTKANIATKRKKARIDGSHDHPDDSADDNETSIPVKMVNRKQIPRFTPVLLEEEDGRSFDSDPILGYTLRPVSLNHDPLLPLNVEPEGEGEVEKFEVNLPDELQRMLALGFVESKSRDSHEALVFKALLHGQTSSRYDPVRGGEIWNIGEDDSRFNEEGESRKDVEEEDWEGEPVPWEVGEL